MYFPNLGINIAFTAAVLVGVSSLTFKQKAESLKTALQQKVTAQAKTSTKCSIVKTVKSDTSPPTKKHVTTAAECSIDADIPTQGVEVEGNTVGIILKVKEVKVVKDTVIEHVARLEPEKYFVAEIALKSDGNPDTSKIKIHGFDQKPQGEEWKTDVQHLLETEEWVAQAIFWCAVQSIESRKV